MNIEQDEEEELLLALLLQEEQEPERRRRMWVRQPVLRRQEMGEFRALMAQERENGSAFHNAYRMSPEAFDELTVQLEPALRRQDTNFRLAITPAEKLALTIRYLASGMSQKDVARYFRLGRATVSKAIPEVCQAIWNIIGPIELPPLTEESWLEDAAEFERRWNFPHCLGAIDGKHIAIQKPGLSGSAFYNYKGGCSVLLMAVADADYRFKYVHVGAFGREHDSTVFNRCGFGQRLARSELNLPVAPEGDLPYCFVGDEAFPLRETIMRPYPGRALDEGDDAQQTRRKVYNYRLSRARRVVENAFGILVTKWRIFRQPIIAKTSTVDDIVRASCVLHNFLRRRDGVSNDRRYIEVNDVDHDDRDGNVVPGPWRAHGEAMGLRDAGRLAANTYTRAAASARDKFAEFFVSEQGRLPWQEAVVRRGARE